MRIHFIVLPLVMFMFWADIENADAQGSSVVRPTLVDGSTDGTQIAEPGEYQVKVGDFLELEYSYPPAATPEALNSASSNTNILAKNGLRAVVVPGLEGKAQKAFRFRAINEGASNITINIDEEEYQYSITVEQAENGAGRAKRIIRRRPPRREPALSKGSYKAIQIQNTVHLFANGMNSTPGHKNYFEKAENEISPPQFSLMVERPAGMVTQVMTPFSAHTSFTSRNPLESITITDRDGQHEVEILQVK